jgi:rod shape-determining protein MreC
MRNLLKLLYAYHFLILFLFLEGFSLFLIIKGSNFHHARFIESSNAFAGSIYKRRDKIKSYLSLKIVNEALLIENTQLRNKLASIRKIIIEKKDTLIDTIVHQRYTYLSANIVNNSISKRDNYITINKGSLDGIHPDMGVISNDGIVGFVQSVSEHYATIISVLNQNFSVSAKVKKNGYYGLLKWDGINSRICQLYDLPHHVPIQKGDTIVTSGYTNFFPTDILIGVVDDFKIEGGNFYKVEVKLSVDFQKIDYVMLIDDLQKSERINLEAMQNVQ